MSFKKGDKVLVEAVFDHHEYDEHLCYVTGIPCDSVGLRQAAGGVHSHPGVSVADLLEEIELLWKMMGVAGDLIYGGHAEKARALRRRREEAQKPKLQEGQEVWVRATAKKDGYCDIEFQGDTRKAGTSIDAKISIRPYPDDIRTEEP